MKRWFQARPYLLGALPSTGLAITAIVTQQWGLAIFNMSIVLLLLAATEVLVRKARRSGVLPLSEIALKRSEADVPIIAYKVANLYTTYRGQPYLRSMFYSLPYEYEKNSDHAISDHAICRMVDFERLREFGRHHPPVLRCTCGFYAMKSRERVLEEHDELTSGLCVVLLEVELFGKVIVCEHGYRAERQRILQLSIPRGCFFCGGQRGDVAAEGMAGTKGGPLIPTCRHHHGHPLYYSFERLANSLAVPVGALR